MVIKTVASNSNKSMTVNVNGQSFELKFNIIGECEVKDDKVAKALLSKYTGLLWEKDQEIEQPKTFDEKITEDFVNELHIKIDRLEATVKTKKEEVEVLQEELKVWKDKFNEIEGEYKGSINSLKEENLKLEKLLQRSTLEVGLWKSSANDLKKLCADSKFKKEDYEKLVKKEDLIDFILTKE